MADKFGRIQLRVTSSRTCTINYDKWQRTDTVYTQHANGLTLAFAFATAAATAAVNVTGLFFLRSDLDRFASTAGGHSMIAISTGLGGLSAVAFAMAIRNSAKQEKPLVEEGTPAVSGQYSEDKPCDLKPEPGVRLSVILRDDLRETIVPLESTNAQGDVKVDLLEEFRTLYPSWPRSTPEVQSQLRVVQDARVDKVLATIDMRDLPGLQFYEHSRYHETIREEQARVAAAKKSQELEEEQRRRANVEKTLQTTVGTAAQVLAKAMLLCAWPTAQYRRYEAVGPSVEVLDGGKPRVDFTVRLFGTSVFNLPLWVNVAASVKLSDQRDKVLQVAIEWRDYDKSVLCAPGQTAARIKKELQGSGLDKIIVCPKPPINLPLCPASW